MVHTLSAELVVAQCVFSCNQPKRSRLDDRVPIPCFGADGTVTFVRSSTYIDVSLEPHSTAVAASYICFLHAPSLAKVYNIL